MSKAQFVIYNGEVIQGSNAPIELQNRGFRYGDGLFETIRITGGEPRFVDAHYHRLISGMKVLKMELPDAFSTTYFENHLKNLIQRNGVKEGGVARLSVFRKDGGTYRPKTNSVSFALEVNEYEDNHFELNQNGLNIDVYSEIVKPINELSVFKTSNALLYVMASIHAQENNLDDVLLVNDKGGLLESSSSNVFIVSNGVLYTPGLEEGCVGGTMRMKIINLALANNMKVYECNLLAQNLLAADEVFLTNAVAGVKWVKSYKNKRYFNKTSRFLIERLNESITGNVPSSFNSEEASEELEPQSQILESPVSSSSAVDTSSVEAGSETLNS